MDLALLVGHGSLFGTHRSVLHGAAVGGSESVARRIMQNKEAFAAQGEEGALQQSAHLGGCPALTPASQASAAVVPVHATLAAA
eukprot:6350761-Prymnesium_polylepis.1